MDSRNEPTLLRRLLSWFPGTMTEERLKDSLTKLARAELDRVLDQPLSEKELESMRKKIIRNCHAGQRMYEEYSVELSQLRMHFHHDNLKLQDQPLNKLLTEHVHEERIPILARSAVRRRWQRLGVWKDDWVPKTCDRNNPGVPYHPSDSVLPEEWGWTKNVTPPDDERHPVRRVIRRRTGLRRGQLGPPPPRCRNRSSNSSADEMESFITSRPWFLFKICVFDEEARRERLPLLLPWKFHLDEPRQIVRRQWERMGIWLPKWNKSAEPGWHWYFEERSYPEPEDYTLFDPNAPEKHLSPSELHLYRAQEKIIQASAPDGEAAAAAAPRKPTRQKASSSRRQAPATGRRTRSQTRTRPAAASAEPRSRARTAALRAHR